MARKRKKAAKALKKKRASAGSNGQAAPGKKVSSGADALNQAQVSRRHEPEPLLSQHISIVGWKWIIAVVIMLAVVAVYWNIHHNEFLRFDDRKYIYENETVTGDGGLWAIWADIGNPKPKIHYYPLTYSTFWIEHAIVGLEPSEIDPEQVVGQAAHPLYHWTQILLHAINGILVMLTLSALGISLPIATLTALFFVIHPINVESVAWTAERKNLLSGVMFWLALFIYIRARLRSKQFPGHRRHAGTGYYVAALGVFLLALLSKTAVVVLAPMIILTDRVIDHKWTWSSLKRALPFFAMGIVMALLMVSRDEALGTKKLGELLPNGFKPLVAASIVVHYAGKVVLPLKQLLIENRWDLSVFEPRYWISMTVLVTAIFLIRRYRSRLGEQWLWGLGLFLVTIAPVMGFKRYSWMQWSFVADHYMYYGSVGVILMLVLGAENIWKRVTTRNGAPRTRLIVSSTTALLALVCLASVICLGWRTTQWNRTWRNNLTLWNHTLSLNNDCFQGHGTLLQYHLKHGNLEAAYHHQKEYARILNFYSAWRHCAQLARKLDRHDEALDHYKKAMRLVRSRNAREYAIHTEYARYLVSLGKLDEALVEYKAVLNKNPPTASKLRAEMTKLREQMRK
jgi:hypothetical protein